MFLVYHLVRTNACLFLFFFGIVSMKKGKNKNSFLIYSH